MEGNYAKAYKEVIEILKYVPEEDVNKIPKDMMEMFVLKMDNNYDVQIDLDKSFEEQHLLDETKAILANIFRDYWATDEQREKIKAKESADREKLEEEKREKYNPDDLFKNRQPKKVIEEVIEDKTIENDSNLPSIVERESFFKRLISFIKGIFHM